MKTRKRRPPAWGGFSTADLQLIIYRARMKAGGYQAQDLTLDDVARQFPPHHWIFDAMRTAADEIVARRRKLSLYALTGLLKRGIEDLTNELYDARAKLRKAEKRAERTERGKVK